MLSNHFTLCRPRSPFALNLSQHPGSFPMSQTGHIRWPKYWSFSFSNSTSNEYSGLISFRIDWFDLLAVQGIFKNLLRHHNLKASIFQCSAFLMAQLLQLYMTTGKTIALIRQNFVSKIMSLLLNMLSRFVTAFLPRSKHLLILWLQSSPPRVILEPNKIKFYLKPKKIKLSLLPLFPLLFAMKWWDQMPWS